jgi:ATPase subunit of ABC transporter with duplicated ATPase domains
MKDKLLQLNNVSFKYDSSSDLILKNINLQFSVGWTGIIGTNGAGKTTLLKLGSEQLFPTAGTINSNGITYYCEQRTDNKPDRYSEFVSSFEKRSYKIQRLLHINIDWFDRWDTLSHGERKRCHIAAALFVDSDILLIDEPTNHIDSDTKRILLDALKSYRGIGLIVSHDRQLLDELCSYILSLDDDDKKVAHGNYSMFESERQKAHKSILKVKESLTRQIKNLEKEVKSRKQKASNADKNRSKRKTSAKDHDAKSKLDLARLTGKDATEGKIYSRLKSRMEGIASKRNDLESTAKRELGVIIESVESVKRIIYFEPNESIGLGDKRRLIVPDLYIHRSDKIGITGSNGCGKSTLVRKIAARLKSIHFHFAYIPQEISVIDSRTLLQIVKELKHEEKGKIFTIISRLNSDPKRLLESETPSPGEVRKLMLAKALLDKHELIIMDEPTNHMDLESIKCIETALQNYSASLILVSHDLVFMNNVVDKRWTINLFKGNDYKLEIE